MTARGRPDRVTVKFSEPISTTSAETTANYSITNTAGTVFNVTGATLGADNVTVTLVTDALVDGGNYVLVLNNIQDRAAPAQTIVAGTTAPFTYNSLVGFWRFEEDTGTTTADSSGNGLTGTFAGSPLPTWVPDHYLGASALDFNNGTGTTGGGHVNVNNDPLVQITGPMTVSAWVTMDVNRGGAIVTKGGSSGSRGWRLGVDTASGGVWTFEIASGPSSLVALQVPGVVFGAWTHVAGVYDPNDTVNGPNLKLYTNGILAGTLTGVPGAQNESGVGVGIGTRYDGSVRWDGKIDDARIHARALSEAELRALPELAGTPLAFTIQPTSRTVLPGQSTTFTNAFTGSPPYFIQWKENGAPISGANGLTYTIPAVTVGMNGYQYSVTVSNFGYAITSTNGILTVPNDLVRAHDRLRRL